MVRKQILNEAFNHLMTKKEKHKKMKDLQYNQLEMQEYLKENLMTPAQARIMFRFRTKMEKFSENFKGGKPIKPCPLCNEDLDTQIHSYQCKIILKNIKISGNIEDIYNQTISKEAANTLENIVKFREKYL